MKTVKVHSSHSNHICGCDAKRLTWKSFVTALLSAFVVAGLIIAADHIPAKAQQNRSTCISREEVASALENEKCLVIQNNKVYDFTEEAKLWSLEGHVDQHLCGQEYTNDITEQGPHGAEVVDKFYLADLCSEQPEESETVTMTESSDKRPPFRIFGMTVRFFFAYVSLFAFLFNFASCYAMPWAKWKTPWRGERPGPDGKDVVGRLPLSHWHKYFAWIAVFSFSVHGFLAFACVWWSLCY